MTDWWDEPDRSVKTKITKADMKQLMDAMVKVNNQNHAAFVQAIREAGYAEGHKVGLDVGKSIPNRTPVTPIVHDGTAVIHLQPSADVAKVVEATARLGVNPAGEVIMVEIDGWPDSD